jgi:8-oxo-dGTP pyrophosphatase MutT (NUDIX family)
MDFKQVINALETELMKPLPGKDVQFQMSSARRIREITDESQIKNGVRSSVLILFYPCLQGDEISVVLIQRPSYEGVHGGQISLPGGRSEKTDVDLKETALREAKEEIGIDPAKIITIGILTELYIPPSNFLVLPFVGYMLEKPIFNIDPKEVAGLIEITLTDLKNDKNVKSKDIFVKHGFSLFGPCFEINGYTIWGATAMILNEFKEIVKRVTLLNH